MAAVTEGAGATPRELLPGEKFDQPRELRIEVLEDGRVLAVFKILTRFTVLDYATRGDAADDPATRVDNYQRALELDPSSVMLRDKLIDALIEADRKDRAAEIYEGELARLGPDEDLLTRLLELYTDLALAPKRVEVLNRLIQLAESQKRPTLPFQRQLAEVYKDSGRPNQAAEMYERLVEDAPPEQAAAYLGELVGLYRDSGRNDREIATLKRLVEVCPPEQVTGIWAEIVALYDRSGDENGRLDAWRALAEALPEGQSKIDAYKMLAYLLAGAKKYDEARAAYQTALKMAPRDLNIVLNLAGLASAAGDRPAYRANLARAVELAPDNLEYRQTLAAALAADGQNDKAKAQYLEILALRPEDREIRVTLIALLEKMGDKNGLINQYEELGRRFADHPENKVIAYNLGVLRFEKKQWAEAAEAFKKAVEIDSADREARDYLLAAYQRQGRTKEMLAEALELYRLDPSKTLYLTLMLNTYENAKDWENFARVAREATRLEPENPAGWKLLAKAQTRQNKKEEAAKSLWKAAETTKDKKVEAWLETASAFAALGKTDETRQAYRKVLDLDPKNERAAKAISELDQKKSKKNS